MKYTLFYNILSGLWGSTLLGGEFANCHGFGTTPEEARISLKLTVKAKRRLASGLKSHELEDNPTWGSVKEEMQLV